MLSVLFPAKNKHISQPIPDSHVEVKWLWGILLGSGLIPVSLAELSFKLKIVSLDC